MDKQEMLRRYLDDELSADQEREALHLIADDPEMRSLLRFERKMRNFVGDMDVHDRSGVPEGFTDRVITKIENREAAPPGSGLLQMFKNGITSLWRPRTLNVRPAYGLVLAAVVLFTVTIPLYSDLGLMSPEQGTSVSNSMQRVEQATAEQVWVRFVYVDEDAESIQVAGDFNNWEPEPLVKQQVNGDQVWTALVPMSRGEHLYMFVKNDQQWVTDPMAPVHREDGFGNKNAVIFL